MSLSKVDIKEAFQQVAVAVDNARRDALAKAFAEPEADKRAATATMLKAKFEPLRAKVSPETWANVLAQLDHAAVAADVDPLMAALDAADAEIKAKR